jgi:hypothetical protein
MLPDMGFEPIKTGMFRSVKDLFMFIGGLVAGGFILLYMIKEIVKEIVEVIYARKKK